MQHHHPVDASGIFNGPLGAELRAQLAPHENVQAALSVDLTVSLRFAQGLLVLTENRIVGKDADSDWQSWQLSADLQLRLMDHAGVGTLARCGGGRQPGACAAARG
jgi:ATP-binding cassette subfamily B protein